MLEVYEEIEPELGTELVDVLLNRRPDATERLVDFRRKDQSGQHRRGHWLKKIEEEEWRKGHG